MVLAGLAIVVLLLTSPQTTADAPEYARDIVAAHAGDTRMLIEPGHLAWRPLGLAITSVLGIPSDAHLVERIRVTQGRMTVVAMVGGVIAAIAMAHLTMLLGGNFGLGLLAALVLACSSAYINYAQAGTSYVPGLACLVSGLAIGWGAGSPSLRRASAGGSLIALAVLFWLPYVLVVPAALAGWWLVREGGDVRGRMRELAAATVTCAAIGLATFAVAAGASGIRDLPGFLAWIGETSHEVTTGGLLRAALGFPRSFIFMGEDGRLVKQFLMGDPLNPVSRGDLLRLGLWPRMAVFYAACVALLVALRGHARARRWLAVAAIAAVPAFGLALKWMGGDLERYLALYPFLVPLLALAVYESVAARRPLLAGPLVALLGFALWNVVALGPRFANGQARAELARLACVADSLRPDDLLIVPHHGDPLFLFARNELERVPRRSGAEVMLFIRAGAPEMASWRDSLEARVDRRLKEGGRVWVARYVRDVVPPREVGWVEGLDRRAGWRDVRAFWAGYDLRETCGGTGGFLSVAGRTESRVAARAGR